MRMMRVIISSKKSLKKAKMDESTVRAYLQTSCSALGFDIGEVWWIRKGDNREEGKPKACGSMVHFDIFTPPAPLSIIPSLPRNPFFPTKPLPPPKPPQTPLFLLSHTYLGASVGGILLNLSPILPLPPSPPLRQSYGQKVCAIIHFKVV